MSAQRKIAVIGYGYVGKAFVEMVRERYGVVVYDPEYDLAHNFDNVRFSDTIESIEDCFAGVVCVPTPSREDGSCDTSMVEEAIMQLKTELILIKSTIAPGTTDELKKKSSKRIVFSPEYVGESAYYNPYFNSDMKATPFLIVGGEKKDCNDIIDILLPILGPTKVYYKTTSLNAELIKYMENTYFAIKITFANEMYAICQAAGADWHAVREGWLLDPRVERMHTAVFAEQRGFGGKCFPKDTKALVCVAKKYGYDPAFIEEMIRTNQKFLAMNSAPKG